MVFERTSPFKFTRTKYVISLRRKERFGAKFTTRDHFYSCTGSIKNIWIFCPGPFLVEKWQFLEFYSINRLVVPR